MSLRNDRTQASQTEFVDQAPFLDEKSSKKFDINSLKKNKAIIPFYILIALVFFAFVFFLLASVFKKQPEAETTPTKVEENAQLDPLTQRVYDLRQNLKDNDPTKQSLPFPQVDLEFNIN